VELLSFFFFPPPSRRAHGVLDFRGEKTTPKKSTQALRSFLFFFFPGSHLFSIGSPPSSAHTAPRQLQTIGISLPFPLMDDCLEALLSSAEKEREARGRYVNIPFFPFFPSVQLAFREYLISSPPHLRALQPHRRCLSKAGDEARSPSLSCPLFFFFPCHGPPVLASPRPLLSQPTRRLTCCGQRP